MASHVRAIQKSNHVTPLPSHVLFSWRERCCVCGASFQPDLDVATDAQGTRWRKYSCEDRGCVSLWKSDAEPNPFAISEN